MVSHLRESSGRNIETGRDSDRRSPEAVLDVPGHIDVEFVAGQHEPLTVGIELAQQGHGGREAAQKGATARRLRVLFEDHADLIERVADQATADDAGPGRFVSLGRRRQNARGQHGDQGQALGQHSASPCKSACCRRVCRR